MNIKEFGKVELKPNALNSIFGGTRNTEYGSMSPSGTYTKQGTDLTQMDGQLCNYTYCNSGPREGTSTTGDENCGCTP